LIILVTRTTFVSRPVESTLRHDDNVEITDISKSGKLAHCSRNTEPCSLVEVMFYNVIYDLSTSILLSRSGILNRLSHFSRSYRTFAFFCRWWLVVSRYIICKNKWQVSKRASRAECEFIFEGRIGVFEKFTLR